MSLQTLWRGKQRTRKRWQKTLKRPSLPMCDRKRLGRLAFRASWKMGATLPNPAGQPDALIAGYMLLDWWDRRYPHFGTLRFTPTLGGRRKPQVASSSPRPAQVHSLVRELTGLGYLNYAETQHEPVNRLYSQPPHTLLERYYQER